MRFQLLPAANPVAQDARFDELLIAAAAASGPAACIWETGQSLVVPRTYQRFDNFTTVNAGFAREGWPVALRHSGGGIVPQGPGIVNVSLAYAVQGKPLDHSDQAYQLLCEIVSRALQRLGIVARAQAVQGSFCDGRYNLAVGSGAACRKIAGTAQLWRRHPRSTKADDQIVLVHALVLVNVDADAVTEVANRYETALGSARRYDSRRVTSVRQLVARGTAQDGDLMAQLKDALEQELAQEISHGP